jgi:hypothetical protein
MLGASATAPVHISGCVGDVSSIGLSSGPDAGGRNLVVCNGGSIY